MTFPKLVVHAAVAGLYGGVVVVVLLRLANPATGPGDPLFRIAAIEVVAAYALAGAIAWPLLYAGLRFFARHRLHLRWLSLRYINGFFSVHMAILLASGWTMLSRYRSGLPPATADRLTRVCALLTLAWGVVVVVAVTRSLRRRTGPQAIASGFALLALLVAWRIAAPPASGPPALRERPSSDDRPAGADAATRGPRLLLLDFDGADLDTILTMQAQGKLPGFSRLVQEGSYGRLASIGPCAAPVTRTTLVTGMLPHRHGVRGPVLRSLGEGAAGFDIVPPGIAFDVLLAPLLETRAAVVSDRRTPAFWEISGQRGGRVAEAGWDLDLDAVPAAAVSAPGGTIQKDWVAKLLDPEVFRQKDPRSLSLVREIVRAVSADAATLGALRTFEERDGAGVAALCFPGLDRVAHVFLRYARPADFGNVSGRDVDLYGAVLERYYQRIDAIVASVLQSEPDAALVLVTATHGIDPAPPLHRLRDELLGGEHLSGVHADAPPGFLFAHGSTMARGRVFGKGSIADVTPTILYALGLPVARDASGSILAGAFSEAFTSAHPVTVIGSYDRKP